MACQIFSPRAGGSPPGRGNGGGGCPRPDTVCQGRSLTVGDKLTRSSYFFFCQGRKFLPMMAMSHYQQKSASLTNITGVLKRVLQIITILSVLYIIQTNVWGWQENARDQVSRSSAVTTNNNQRTVAQNMNQPTELKTDSQLKNASPSTVVQPTEEENPQEGQNQNRGQPQRPQRQVRRHEATG